MSPDFDKSKDADSHGEERVFEQYLKSRGLKFTPARRQLLRAIFSLPAPFTAHHLPETSTHPPLPPTTAPLYPPLPSPHTPTPPTPPSPRNSPLRHPYGHFLMATAATLRRAFPAL